MVWHADEVALCRALVKAESATDTRAQRKERNNRLMKSLEEVALKLDEDPKNWETVKKQLSLLRKTSEEIEDLRRKQHHRNSLRSVEEIGRYNAINNPINNPINNAKTSKKLRQDSADWIAAQAAEGLMRSIPEVHFFNAVLYVTCCY